MDRTPDTMNRGILWYKSYKEKTEPNIQLIGEINTKEYIYPLLVDDRYHFIKHIGDFLELGYGVT